MINTPESKLKNMLYIFHQNLLLLKCTDHDFFKKFNLIKECKPVITFGEYQPPYMDIPAKCRVSLWAVEPVMKNGYPQEENQDGTKNYELFRGLMSVPEMQEFLIQNPELKAVEHQNPYMREDYPFAVMYKIE